MSGLTGMQIRMARAGLGWTIADLAKRAGVATATVRKLEAVDGAPGIAAGVEQTREVREAARAASVEAIRKAITSAGVTLLSDDGKSGAGVRGKLAKNRTGDDRRLVSPQKTPRGTRKKGRGVV